MGDSFGIHAAGLESRTAILRGLSVDDSPAVFAYASDPEVARYTLWAPHESEEHTRDFLRMLTGPETLSWAILARENTAVVGIIFLHSLSLRHRKAEIAFNVARGQWGRGVATEASRAVLEYAFGPIGLNRVEATCMPANSRSRRVLEKLGMALEGRLRRSHLRHDGFHDMDLFSVLRGEAGT